jgi:Carboxypeptidase regulatory-like domain
MAAGRPTNIVLVLTKGFPVSGEVLTADGQPVARAMICKQSGASRCATSDEEGRFFWPRVEPGRVWVNVRADGFEELNQSFQVTNGLTEVVLQLTGDPGVSVPRPSQRETVRLEGSVIDADTQQAIPLFKVLQGEIFPSAGRFGNALLSNGRFLGEGHNGQFDWELSQSQILGAFQAEAKGYLPAVLAMDTPLEFKLHSSRIVEGLVRTPEGATADGASVSLSGMGFGCTMQKEGQLLSPNRQFESTRTKSDRDGRFTVQSMTGAEGLVAVHRSGYAYLPMPLASNVVLILEHWGAIEGVLYVGGRPAPREFVWVDGVQELPVKSRFALSFSYRTQTDQDGHFRFDCVPAGDHLVSRMVNYMEDKTCSPMDSHTTLAAVRPSQTATVELWGQGRMVVGRIALADPGAEVSRGMSKAFLLLQGSAPPQPTIFENPGEHWRALRLYNAQAQFPFLFQPDGTIRADDVPPGSYTLQIELRAATPDPNLLEKSLGTVEQKVTIPTGDALVDLGTLRVR